ncbi:carbohydrate-binding protein [Sporomusa malonica]|uniref:Starch/carbohydrate-binding module (Family 53) n=1 Tax=Sporomusa malonica TaxID=112901 RepID=A0A1W2CSN1_9FIRM|nr:carbohydrate-binding protein [Sporomusa malonica]SMC88240.1 Starch/carbohydrate-binding module (family 53) [Sporomusa malonica]
MAKCPAKNCVTIHPEVPSNQSIAKITYNGLLPKSGATEVYAHVGYGRMWENTQDYKMTKTAHGFDVLIPIPEHADSLNICFKDAANNWDNNAGTNYSFVISTPSTDHSLEFAAEISMWDNMINHCESNLSTCKRTIRRWMRLSD